MGAGRTADRRLVLFVALVVATGGACLAWAIFHVTAPPSLLYLLTVAAIVVVAKSCGIGVRIGGESHQVTCTSAAILIALLVLPVSLAVITVTGGVLVVQIAGGGMQARKIAFNAAAHAIGVTAAAAAVSLCGLAHDLTFKHGTSWATQLAALAVAAAAYAVVDELLTPTVVALAARLRWRTVVTRDLDISSGIRLANFLIVGVTILLLDRRPDFILVIPFAIATVFLAASQKLRHRAEERTAQQLAVATADLVSTDLTTVLHRAAHAAARLLSAAEAEVEAHIGTDVRLVRIHQDTVVYDGPALDAPPSVEAPAVVVGEDVGRATALVRLRFKSPTTLSESEHDALRAFTVAVNSALTDIRGDQQTVHLLDRRNHAATHDPLTGLGNRRYLEERATPLLLEPGCHGVALLDLNRFKHVNDTLGHEAGDQLLVEFARRLAAGVTGPDIVARLGGDEFTVVFANLPSPADGVRRMHDLLRAALTEPITVHGVPITMEAAAGIAAGPAAGGLPELLRRADVAMYQAKLQRRLVCAYRPERDIAGDLSMTGQVAVTFQPVVNLATERLIGAHALASWHHRHRHRINPQRLALEHPSTLSAYSRHVLDRTLHAISSWRTSGIELPAAVHVTARSLLDPDFGRDLRERLVRANVPADQLTIELNETLLHANFGAANNTIKTLADMGVRLGLTEFGAGATSLATLARMPVHQLTIASQLAAQIERPQVAAIVRSIVDLGRNLNLAIVVDGVETDAQRIALLRLGCVSGEGSLFGDAVNAEDLVVNTRRIPRQATLSAEELWPIAE